MKELTSIFDRYIEQVSELSDNELAGLAEVTERALIHFLVEQQMRVNSVSPLRIVQ